MDDSPRSESLFDLSTASPSSGNPNDSTDSLVHVRNPDEPLPILHPSLLPSPSSSSPKIQSHTFHKQSPAIRTMSVTSIAQSLPVQQHQFDHQPDLDTAPIGFILTATEVREILTESKYFVADQIAYWNTDIMVPYGTNAKNYVAIYVAKKGFRFNALYDGMGGLVKAPQGLSHIEVWKRNFMKGLRLKEPLGDGREFEIMRQLAVDPIPPSVTCDVGEYDTNLFSPSGLHAGYPNKILSFRCPNGNTNEKFIEFQLKSLHDRLGHSSVLYRGITCITEFIHALAVGAFLVPNPSADFGHGMYFTSDFNYAKLYAEEGGCVAIYEWNGPGQCSMREVVGDDWQQYVKWHCGHTNVNVTIPRPPMYSEDFLSGAISVDTFATWECNRPVPTNKIQIVAKTARAVETMASRLVGVVCVA